MRSVDQGRPAARPGVVYLVGAGPSDPSLATARAIELLASADVVLHDELVHPDLLRHARPDASIEYVGKRGTEPADKQAKQSAIDARLVALGLAGKSVVRLKGGDPYLFGRGSEEAEALVDAGVPFEVVPGVTSPVAAATYAGFSLTHRDLASSVTFVSATTRGGALFDFSELASVRGTICVLMGWRRLEAICDAIVHAAKRDPATPAAMVESASAPKQRVVVGTLSDLAARVRAEKIGTPSILVVGDVVRLRERLRWFDRLPLFGKRVLVTRAAHQAEATSTLLRARGADPIELATIAIHPPPDPARVTAAIHALGAFDVVALTSENGVAALFAALDAAGLDARAFGRARVAAIGAGTARALVARGIKPDVVPTSFRGEALAEAILADVRARGGEPRGARVMIPRALVAREILPDTLREAGMIVDVVPVYETRGAGAERALELRDAFSRGDIDVVLATSPSTIVELSDLLGEDARRYLAQTLVASIGGVTTAAAEARGVTVGVTATESTVAGLVDALEAHFEARSR